MRVGLLGYLRPRGLAVDLLSIRAALAGAPDIVLSVFPVADLYEIDRILRKGKHLEPARPAPGWEWPEAQRDGDILQWVRGLDVLVTLEVLPKSLSREARSRGIRHVHVPNLEWIPVRDGFAEDLALPAALVAKTRHTVAALTAFGLENVLFVPWSVPLGPEPPRPARKPVHFVHLAGVGSSLDAKNPSAVLNAFAADLGDDPDATLTVHAQVPFRRRKVRIDSRPFLRHRNVRISEGERSREEVLSLLRSADVAVQPSRVEGFGLAILESLALSVPVVTTDGAPMNELVQNGRNGLLVPATETGRHRHVPILEVDRRELGRSLRRLASDPGFVDALKEGAGAEVAERWATFRSGIREALGVKS